MQTEGAETPPLSVIMPLMSQNKIKTTETKIEITEQMIQKWYPLIAIPCYDQQLTEPFFMSTMKMVMGFKGIGLNFAIATISDSLITRARNQLVAKFMANPDFTHLMFIDADIGFDSEDIIKLLWHDKDVMTAAYPIKEIRWDVISDLVKDGHPSNELLSKSLRYVVNPVKDGSGHVKVDNGALNIYDAGTGFMLIKREVFVKMFDSYPELKYKDDTGSLNKDEREQTYALFNSYIDDDGRLLSEDYGFCRYWQKLGGSVWVDPTVRLSHLGRMKYTGKMIDYINIIESEFSPEE
jgi:hypothetical protein